MPSVSTVPSGNRAVHSLFPVPPWGTVRCVSPVTARNSAKYVSYVMLETVPSVPPVPVGNSAKYNVPVPALGNGAQCIFLLFLLGKVPSTV